MSYNINNVLLIQRYFRKHLKKQRNIPLSLTVIKLYLDYVKITLKGRNRDGRINSILDENTIWKYLVSNKNVKEIVKRYKKRCGFDILVKDIQFGLIPVNIKLTSMKTNDNVGNLSVCLYSYTNHEMKFTKNYNNGVSSKILTEKLKNKEYNNTNRDYWFLVVNKNTKEIVINSIRGLSRLTKNMSNLPFQICWNKNKVFFHKTIESSVLQFINVIDTKKTGEMNFSKK